MAIKRNRAAKAAKNAVPPTAKSNVPSWLREDDPPATEARADEVMNDAQPEVTEQKVTEDSSVRLIETDQPEVTEQKVTEDSSDRPKEDHRPLITVQEGSSGTSLFKLRRREKKNVE